MKIVSKTGCGLCVTVKTILQKKKVQYTEFPVDSDEGHIILNMAKSNELPIILLDDNTCFSGIKAYTYAKSL